MMMMDENCRSNKANTTKITRRWVFATLYNSTTKAQARTIKRGI